jgi:electron transport complex protein RnfB
MSDVYEKLRERLDEYSIGFRSTGTGLEIRLLKRLFTEEEAHMYLNLKRSLQSASDIAEKTGRPEKEVEEMLRAMTEKGLTIPRFPKKKGEPFYYAAAPYLHGLFEHQVKGFDKDTAKLMLQLNRVGYYTRGPAPLRTIPVGAAVATESRVAPYEDVRKVLESKRRIAVADCACAVVRGSGDASCTRPREVCLMFDFYADYYIDRGLGRELQKEEIPSLLEKCEKAGLVPQFGNSANPDALCNCCPDCCESLQAVKRSPKPAKSASANYFCTVDTESCIGCGDCEDRCPMDAVSLSEEDTAQVDLLRCIGCGLCVSTCPEEALRLVRKPEETIRIPPEKHDFMRSSAEYEADLRGRARV